LFYIWGTVVNFHKIWLFIFFNDFFTVQIAQNLAVIGFLKIYGIIVVVLLDGV